MNARLKASGLHLAGTGLNSMASELQLLNTTIYYYLGALLRLMLKVNAHGIQGDEAKSIRN